MVVDLRCKLQSALRLMRDEASIAKALMIYNHHGCFSDIQTAILRATFRGNNPLEDDDNYVRELLFLVANNPGSIMFLAERLTRRLGKTRNHLVALKTLLLIHRLLRGGSRSFEQQLREAFVSGHLQMNLHHQLPDSSPAPRSLNFLLNYAAFLDERMDWFINQSGKLEPITQQKLDFQILNQNERMMSSIVNRIFKFLQFLDKTMNCSPFDVLSPDENNNNNSPAMAALSSTLKESFQVYMALWDGLVSLINMYFDLPQPARIIACDVLKKASKQSQELYNFYRNCRGVIEHKHLEYPLVHIITMDHVLAMEQLNLAQSTAPKNFTVDSCKIITSSDSFTDHHQMLDYLTNSSSSSSSSSSQAMIEECGENSLVPMLFSSKMETKISKVWVVFDDENKHDADLLL